MHDSPIWQLTLSRLREFYRQPEAIFWVYFFPILMVVALGIAFRSKPVEISTIDFLDSSRGQTLVNSLSDHEQILASLYSEDDGRRRLRTGKADVFVIARDGTDNIEFVLDPTKPGSLLAKNNVNRILQTGAGRTDPIATEIVEFSEPGGRYIDFLIPGLLGMGLMGGGLWGVGFAVVDLRIRKLLKRFLATPMKKTHFLIGIMISRMIFMVPEILLLIGFSWWFFDVQVYGNWFSILFLILLGAVEFSGVGLLVASRAKTLESVSGLMNLVMLPMWTLSGIFFSYERFPDVVQPVIKAIPLTPLNDALRSVMTEGASLAAVWPEIAIMSAWSVVTFVLALLIFRWSD